jgi:GalNAc5-diNAcBac-PP-undecaprenol beta-1,3-glucosyltransferase
VTLKSNKPEISIIMATYNRGHFIKETLNSIINQSFLNWECIIIDDGSIDNTSEIVEAFIHTDNRFRYYGRLKDYKKGLPGCRNMGLDLATGNYVLFFDDDDIVHPDNLQTCHKVISQSNSHFCRYYKQPFTGTWTKPIFPEHSELKKEDFKLKDLVEMVTGIIPFASCTVLWDKKCFEGVRFNEDLMYGEEWECYSRILSLGYEGILIDKILYYNRKHSNSNTGEFWNKDSYRVNSYINAALLIIDNLGRKKLLNRSFKKFFIRLGFELNSHEIIEKILKATNSGKLEEMKYLFGFKVYPILRPMLHLKGKILKI